ncbi:MAG: N-acetylmuramoyl-L-alanine amidase [Lachnospiraceae bacterium]|nr:N-acetylmuramoyl-L-alanine amidase [Lachnospiraceae bacterium]
MKLSDKKLFWMIIAAALIIGAILGCGIYFGGRAVQKQRAEQELAKQEEERLLAEKQAQQEEEARLKEEEAQKELERLEQEKAEAAAQEAREQDEMVKDAGADIGLADVTGSESEQGIVPEENQDESTVLPAASNGYKIAIDAGHQGQGNSEQEPIGPGASETKAKVTSGTHGAASGLDEYELNLTVALKLKDELLSRGYEVFMIRETHDVNISNSERAQMAANSGSDILVRIHANGLDNTSVQGALTMAPKSDNPFMSQDLISASQTLSQVMVDQFCAATGANNMGVQYYNNMSGINWSTIPVTIVEMGFMTNTEEDLRMAGEEYQNKMAQGMANGIDAYFGL